MRKKLWMICMALLGSLLFGVATGEAAEVQPTQHIGLHDRLLPITDIRIIDGDVKVPLNEFITYMDAKMDVSKGKLRIQKRGSEIVYQLKSQRTSKAGVEASGSPILDIDGNLFISVTYFAEATGFKIDAMPTVNTLRIYRDDYEHMGSIAYEKHIQALVVKPQVPKATVYLTFDDGPNRYTRANVSTLKKYQVQGTFFFLGKHMKKNEDIVRTVADAGHYIGTHSMTHDVKKVYESPETFIEEMNEGTQLIQQITGNEAKLLRVPYGSKPHVTPAMKRQLNVNGYKMWDWHVDSNDWRYTDQQVGEIVKNVRNGVQQSYKSGNRDIIILLHDQGPTTKALPAIIEWLQKEGYTLKTYEPEHHVIRNFLYDTTL
ncbi:polysaccharide deacetylase family protein [Sporosarcina sp. FSL K6-1522]|uniref:polysaccharide deacetylase family protein n=1 Tax=Sporosarcina sp. FSL K6-1522 TaxID=2921554 RepID=UPI003159F407